MEYNINACFLSYRHTNDRLAHRYVLAFYEQLCKHLHWLLPNASVFFDENGLKVGDNFSEEIAFELCRSACMIIFYSPLHFDISHPYCALEYHAMLDLERQRSKIALEQLRGKGLVFPVIFRGRNYLPAEIRDSRQFVSFDDVYVEKDFRKTDCQRRIQLLAEQIFDRYRVLLEAGAFVSHNCRDFLLPTKDSITAWLKEVAAIKAYPMPGR
jgi:TIR domain